MTQFRGVRPNMEEMTVDPVILLLTITAPFRNAIVSVHKKTSEYKSFDFISKINRKTYVCSPSKLASGGT